MTDEEYRAFRNRVVNTTNFCCVATLWVFGIPSWPALPAVLVMLFMFGYSMVECRKAERRHQEAYQEAVKKHLDAGGMVMMVKRGRRLHPVPVPIFRDLS